VHFTRGDMRHFAWMFWPQHPLTLIVNVFAGDSTTDDRWLRLSIFAVTASYARSTAARQAVSLMRRYESPLGQPALTSAVAPPDA
jgi:hypothetical protein